MKTGQLQKGNIVGYRYAKGVCIGTIRAIVGDKVEFEGQYITHEDHLVSIPLTIEIIGLMNINESGLAQVRSSNGGYLWLLTHSAANQPIVVTGLHHLQNLLDINQEGGKYDSITIPRSLGHAKAEELRLLCLLSITKNEEIQKDKLTIGLHSRQFGAFDHTKAAFAFGDTATINGANSFVPGVPPVVYSMQNRDWNIEENAFIRDYESDFGVPPFMDLINKMTKEFKEKKDSIIKQKLEEKGLSHLLVDIKNQRFKRIAIEQCGNLEKWYADNGTNEGLLIVTFDTSFVTKAPDNFIGDFSIESLIKYY